MKLYYKLDDSLCFHKINRFCLIFKTNNEALEGSTLEVIFVDFFPNDENRLTVDRRAGDTSLRLKTKERKKKQGMSFAEKGGKFLKGPRQRHVRLSPCHLFDTIA